MCVVYNSERISFLRQICCRILGRIHTHGIYKGRERNPKPLTF